MPAESEDSAPAAPEHFDAIVARYAGELSPAAAADAPLPLRYLLVERSSRQGGVWLTAFNDPADAAVYHDCQEHPQDWVPEVLWDCVTGTRYRAVTATLFFPVAALRVAAQAAGKRRR